MRRKRESTFSCPHCGATVRDGALACPDCGSDASTGWSPDADVESVDLPETELGEEDYGAFLDREGLGRRRAFPPWGIALFLALLALLVAFVLLR